MQTHSEELSNELANANRIVRKHTAFGSYFELTDAMASTGYVPTLSRKRQGEMIQFMRQRSLRFFEVP